MPIAFLFIFKKKFYLSLVLFLSISTISTLGIILTTIWGVNNHLILKLYFFSSFICLMYYFKQLLLSKKLIPLIFTTIFIITFFAENILKGKIYWSLQLINFSVVFCCVMLKIKETKEDNFLNINHSVILINSSILVYYSFSFLLFFVMMELISNQLWVIHNIVESTSKLVIAYAFWKLPKTSHY